VARRAAGDDRRRVVLSLTRRGRRLEKRVLATRAGILELARETVGDRDLQPVVEVLRELVEHTAYADLIERRRDLLGAASPLPDA
jgi:DNA-binding MarR family transcriptional regulator